MTRPKMFVCFGTRPEAIKMAPLIHELNRRAAEIDTVTVSTGQHSDLMDDALSTFDIQCDVDLEVMRPEQRPQDVFSAVLTKVGEVLERERPDIVLVHGDTTTSAATSVAAHYAGIEIGHVEAGLRSGTLWAPWPEEANRRMVDSIARWHFAPTQRAAANLAREGHADTVHVTGNTVVDALAFALRKLDSLAVEDQATWPESDYLLVTMHRREHFGEPLDQVMSAVEEISATGRPVIWPVHPNPSVSGPIRERLGAVAGIRLLPAQRYLPFVGLLRGAAIILTDSGGIQEEAPSFRIPVLVARDVTERSEAIDGGYARLVGTSQETIMAAYRELVASGHSLPNVNPFGDGHAAPRIVDVLSTALR